MPRSRKTPPNMPEPTFDASGFSEYQKLAAETSQYKSLGPDGVMAPMLGLAGKAGAILDSNKRYLRAAIELPENQEIVKEELGDLLWYLAAVATANRLDLGDIARQNIRRTRDLYLAGEPTDHLSEAPVFDRAFDVAERLPRKLVVRFGERPGVLGTDVATQEVYDAFPNPFPDGPVVRADGKRQGFAIGAPLGDRMTDNARTDDGYRFHDAIHMAFAAVLGWSPTLRAMLRVKRYSDPMLDNREDGARAIYAEEGLSAILSRLAPRRLRFQRENAVDGVAIDLAKDATSGLEVEAAPGWLWRRAIWHGFRAMEELRSHKGGYLTADLDERSLTYSITAPSRGA